MRHQALKVSYADYFKPTPRTTKLGILMFVPFFMMCYVVSKDRAETEHKYRTGQVAYKDRGFKWI